MLTALPGFTIGLKYAYLTDRQGAGQDVKNRLWLQGKHIGEAARRNLGNLELLTHID